MIYFSRAKTDMPNREPPRPRSRACKHSEDKTTVNEEEKNFSKKRP
jgi:hypothetical protein